MALPYRNAHHHACERDFARVILHFDPRAPRCKQRARAKRLSGRGEGLSLLHDIGDENDGLGVARLAARMGGFGRYLEAIAFFDRAGRLPLDGKLEAAFHDISGFDSRMRVSGDGTPGSIVASTSSVV